MAIMFAGSIEHAIGKGLGSGTDDRSRTSEVVARDMAVARAGGRSIACSTDSVTADTSSEHATTGAGLAPLSGPTAEPGAVACSEEASDVLIAEIVACGGCGKVAMKSGGRKHDIDDFPLFTQAHIHLHTLKGQPGLPL